MHSLARLRLRLTAWYVGVFLSILALLGGGLFLAIRHRMSQQLDASLRAAASRSEEHTSELQSRLHLVCRLLLEKKKIQPVTYIVTRDHRWTMKTLTATPAH